MAMQETGRSLAGLLHDLTDEELLALTDADNRPVLKAFLGKIAAQAWKYVSYNTSIGLMALIQRAVGERNFGDINPDITPERFPLKEIGVRQVKARVEPYLNNETIEQAATRLVSAGYKLGSTGDLAGFLHDHPDQVEEWMLVFAISENSRWIGPSSFGCVPYASVVGEDRDFYLCDLRCRFDSGFGVLVVSEPA